MGSLCSSMSSCFYRASHLSFGQVKMDLTDLYDIMVFFRGNLNGKKGHDELARKIAMAGKDWSNKYWRQEDHTAYMFRSGYNLFP